MTTGAGAIARRTAIGGMAAAGLGFIAFGPRGSKERSDGRLVLDYWEKWTGLEGRAMKHVVDRFNDSQSRIFVRYFSTAGIDEKAQITIAGGAPPDILGLWNYNIPGFADTGAIIPLDELGAKFGVGPQIYAPGFAPVTVHKGRFYAAVNTGGTIGMYYNKAHFREVGLDPERPPRTISELDACNRRLQLKRGDRIERMGFHHREPGWWVFIWGYFFGGSLYDEGTDRVTLAMPENIAGYEWVASYPKEFGLKALNDFRSTFGNYDSALNPFIEGRLSMVMQGPWLANMINMYNPGLDYGVAPFPVGDGLYDADAPIGLVDCDVLVIPRDVKNPEASMEFIAYTQRPEVVEYLATVHCKGSPLKTSSEGFLANHPNRGVRVFDAIAKSPQSFRVPSTRAWLQVRDELIWVFDQSWNAQGEPRDLLAAAQIKTQAVLDRFANAERRRRMLAGDGG